PLAMDLGCGAGRDSLALLAAGWRVIAIDRQREAMAELERRVPPALRHRLEPRTGDIRTEPWGSADLVVASFVLHTLAPPDFRALWATIPASLRPRGRFAGHFIGKHDTWAGRDDMSTFSRDDLHHLLNGLEVEFWAERENDGETATGRAKHWHVHHIVARRTA
ncbi:MAG: class I SAM-dependent methyltransferase, partial [Alphaproteobacteria bacterium]